MNFQLQNFQLYKKSTIFQVADLKLTNGRLRKLANKQLRNVQKSVMHVQSCCFAILPFSLPSPSLLLKLSIVVIRKCCYHGNVTSHFSSLLLADKSVWCFCCCCCSFLFFFFSPLLLVRSCGLLSSIRCLQCPVTAGFNTLAYFLNIILNWKFISFLGLIERDSKCFSYIHQAQNTFWSFIYLFVFVLSLSGRLRILLQMEGCRALQDKPQVHAWTLCKKLRNMW